MKMTLTILIMLVSFAALAGTNAVRIDCNSGSGYAKGLLSKSGKDVLGYLTLILGNGISILPASGIVNLDKGTASLKFKTTGSWKKLTFEIDETGKSKIELKYNPSGALFGSKVRGFSSQCTIEAVSFN